MLLTKAAGRVPNKAPQVTGAELRNNFPKSSVAAFGPLCSGTCGDGTGRLRGNRVVGGDT